MSFRLAVSAELVFVDLPFLDRVRRIHELGFEVCTAPVLMTRACR